MKYYLDYREEDMDEVTDVIYSNTPVTPYDAYPHPRNKDFMRMEFTERSNREEARKELNRHDLENYPYDSR